MKGLQVTETQFIHQIENGEKADFIWFVFHTDLNLIILLSDFIPSIAQMLNEKNRGNWTLFKKENIALS